MKDLICASKKLAQVRRDVEFQNADTETEKESTWQQELEEDCFEQALKMLSHACRGNTGTADWVRGGVSIVGNVLNIRIHAG